MYESAGAPAAFRFSVVPVQTVMLGVVIGAIGLAFTTTVISAVLLQVVPINPVTVSVVLAAGERVIVLPVIPLDQV